MEQTPRREKLIKYNNLLLFKAQLPLAALMCLQQFPFIIVPYYFGLVAQDAKMLPK